VDHFGGGGPFDGELLTVLYTTINMFVSSEVMWHS
jgi:hypothetical protein